MYTSQTRLKTLVWLRWITLFAILVGLVLTQSYGQDAPIHWANLVLIVSYGLSNVALRLFKYSALVLSDSLFVFLVLLIDLACLTLFIDWNGGAQNPFSVLFMAISGAGALLLDRKYLAVLVTAALACLGFIYLDLPKNHTTHAHSFSEYQTHLRGMWFANSLGIILTVGWISYLRANNEKTAKEYQKAQAMLLNIERVESLGRLLASTAHQINTPLGTLQIGISELKDPSYSPNADEKKRWANDLQTALDQIQNILSRINLNQTSTLNDPDTLSIEDYLAFVIEHWAKPRTQSVLFSSELSSVLEISAGFAKDLESCLLAVLDNALDAKMPEQTLTIRVKLSEKQDLIQLTVKDDGTGIAPEIIDKVLEPLYTTKPRGTGLGLYVCHQTTRKYHGNLEINSTLGFGTTITLTFKKPEK